MAIRTKEEIKLLFETGDKPTQLDFIDLIDTLNDNPMTTAGDIIYGGASGAPTRLAKGTDGQVCTMVNGLPAWAAASGVSQTTPISLDQGASTTITGITVVGVSTLAAPTYTTTYGTGDRRAIITVTHSGGWYRIGGIQLLVNGQTAGGVDQNVGLYPIDNTGCTIVFSFSAPQLITELKFHTATGYTYGDWVVQGSVDNVSWSANLCASTAMVPLSTVFDMSANTTAYNYYRLLGVGGTIGDGYFHEAEFKIGATEYSLSTPGVDYKTTRSNSSGVQTLTITRLASGTANTVIDYI